MLCNKSSNHLVVWINNNNVLSITVSMGQEFGKVQLGASSSGLIKLQSYGGKSRGHLKGFGTWDSNRRFKQRRAGILGAPWVFLSIVLWFLLHGGFSIARNLSWHLKAQKGTCSERKDQTERICIIFYALASKVNKGYFHCSHWHSHTQGDKTQTPTIYGRVFTLHCKKSMVSWLYSCSHLWKYWLDHTLAYVGTIYNWGAITDQWGKDRPFYNFCWDNWLYLKQKEIVSLSHHRQNQFLIDWVLNERQNLESYGRTALWPQSKEGFFQTHKALTIKYKINKLNYIKWEYLFIK